MKGYGQADSGLKANPGFVRSARITLAIPMETRLSILIALFFLPAGK
jgi:hypothetical protein